MNIGRVKRGRRGKERREEKMMTESMTGHNRVFNWRSNIEYDLLDALSSIDVIVRQTKRYSFSIAWETLSVIKEIMRRSWNGDKEENRLLFILGEYSVKRLIMIRIEKSRSAPSVFCQHHLRHLFREIISVSFDHKMSAL